MDAVRRTVNPLMPMVEFIRRTSAVEDPILAAVHGEAMNSGRGKGGAPPLTPEAGRFLQVLVKAIGAKRVLEVGTGYGYSAIWMARALPVDGQLRTVELDPEHARIAANWIRKAHLEGKVTITEGKATGVLPALPTKFFDLCFIDADKESYPKYWELALRLVRPGGVIVADNVFWFGAAWSQDDRSEAAEGVRAYNRLASSTPGVETIVLPLGDGLSVSFRG